MAKRVFISYSSNDSEAMKVLASDIESLGHEVWFDHELTGGQRWWDHILEEIRRCDSFVFAVSAASADSRACLSEFRYAEALGKPVLPVTVERDFAESLLPPSLSQLQRVDYTKGDKASFAALNRALSSLPPAPELPTELPAAPPVPASYLFDLKAAIDEPGQMAAERQQELLNELRGRLNSGHTHTDVLALTRRFREREDLLLRIDRQLAEFEAELTASAAAAQPRTPAPPPPSAAPAAAMPEPQPAAPRPASATPVGTRSGDVSWFWWVIAILFGIIGGVVAWAVNKDKDSNTARNLLIAGVVANVVWLLLFSY